jgi:hypothetical protein
LLRHLQFHTCDDRSVIQTVEESIASAGASLESDSYVPLMWQQQNIADFASMLSRQGSRAANVRYRETADLKNSLIDFLKE